MTRIGAILAEEYGPKLAALRRLVSDKEPNGYPLWFNRQVHKCLDCDSEDLCMRHFKMATADFANCEDEVDRFLAELWKKGLL
jgi:hypothetical protein